MIEETLINYGVLGIWTLSLLYERYKTQSKMAIVVENNSKALNKVYTIISKCQRK
jgi:hypothetical protein